MYYCSYCQLSDFCVGITYLMCVRTSYLLRRLVLNLEIHESRLTHQRTPTFNRTADNRIRGMCPVGDCIALKRVANAGFHVFRIISLMSTQALEMFDDAETFFRRLPGSFYGKLLHAEQIPLIVVFAWQTIFHFEQVFTQRGTSG